MTHFPQDRYQDLEDYLRILLDARPHFVSGGRTAVEMDCAGLVVVVCQRLGIPFVWDEIFYTRVGELETRAPDHYLSQLRRNFDVVWEPAVPAPGDLLLFRMEEGGAVSHTGWMLASGEMVHIYNEHRGLCRTDWTTRFWRPKYCGYAYPRGS